jgi:hypothetical protein
MQMPTLLGSAVCSAVVPVAHVAFGPQSAFVQHICVQTAALDVVLVPTQRPPNLQYCWAPVQSPQGTMLGIVPTGWQ